MQVRSSACTPAAAPASPSFHATGSASCIATSSPSPMPLEKRLSTQVWSMACVSAPSPLPLPSASTAAAAEQRVQSSLHACMRRSGLAPAPAADAACATAQSQIVHSARWSHEEPASSAAACVARAACTSLSHTLAGLAWPSFVPSSLSAKCMGAPFRAFGKTASFKPAARRCTAPTQAPSCGSSGHWYGHPGSQPAVCTTQSGAVRAACAISRPTTSSTFGSSGAV
mmetsp:Transcript_9346/g.38313  ORF Transcript_9346/g.38313 Transcript_9346/m.38313 type:complete len:227 (+) Transcript_9346:3559-4239(+)